jgi:thioredoxin-like negative regulator of GroEL
MAKFVNIAIIVTCVALLMALALGKKAEPVIHFPDHVAAIHDYEGADNVNDFMNTVKSNEASIDGAFSLVMYQTTWCPYCKQLNTMWDEAGKTVSKPFVITRLDVEKFPEITASLVKEEGVPEVHIYKDGQFLSHFGGVPAMKSLVAILQTAMNKYNAS